MFIENIEKETLLRPLLKIIGIVERKQPLPILSNVLIEKGTSGFHLVATDLEIEIATDFVCASDQNEKDLVTVGAKKLQEVLRVLPDGNSLSVDINNGKFQIKSGKSRFSLQILPAQDFPKMSAPIGSNRKILIPQKSFKGLIGMVQYAMAQQDIRYYLNGVLMIVEGYTLKLVATDGHRLAYANMPLDTEYPEKFEVILPRKTITELFKLLGDVDENVSFELFENQAKISFSDVVITSKIIDGKFPDYGRVVPEYSNHLELNRIEILQALQRAAILSNEKFRGVRFVLTEKNLRIITNNSEQEEAQEDIETDYHETALDIGFNVNYLLEGLNNMSSEKVVFSFGDPNSSILMTIPANEDFKYVVMPMRI